MRGSSLSRKIRAGILAAAVFAASIPMSWTVPVFAEEVAAEGEAAPAEGEAVEGEAVADPFAEGGEALPAEGDMGDMADMSAGTGVTPGTILANNGLYIANTFPDSMMPAGFHRQTVAYQGQNIDLAYMDNSSAVVLAYLTDVTGTVGDFYLCDTATATMSDYVRLEGGNGAYLIILDPGDNINPPAGFNKAVLNIDNKSVTAWTLPDGSSSDKEKEDDKEETDTQGFFNVTQTVYAGDLGLGIGAGSSDSPAADTGAADTGATVVDNSYVDGTTVDGTTADPAATDAAAGTTDYAAEAAAEVAAANVQTDAAGFVKAQPSEFFLVYGVDYNGAQGFFLYDTLGRTYQRYLEIDTGESEATAKFRKSAQIRLFIIAGLILFSVVLIFIIINMSLNGKRGGRNIDDEDDMEEMKKRVRKKEYSSIKKNGGRKYIQDEGFDDEDEYEDNAGYGRGGNGYNNGAMQGNRLQEEEDIRYYDRGSSRTGRGVQRNAAGNTAADRNVGQRPGVRTQMRSDVRTQSRPGVRTEARPGVRTERRYPVQDDPSQYGADNMQDNGDWNGMDDMMGNDMSGGNMNGGYSQNQGQGQDIDLDDDFNFDFIKPGK